MASASIFGDNDFGMVVVRKRETATHDGGMGLILTSAHVRVTLRPCLRLRLELEGVERQVEGGGMATPMMEPLTLGWANRALDLQGELPEWSRRGESKKRKMGVGEEVET